MLKLSKNSRTVLLRGKRAELRNKELLTNLANKSEARRPNEGQVEFLKLRKTRSGEYASTARASAMR